MENKVVYIALEIFESFDHGPSTEVLGVADTREKACKMLSTSSWYSHIPAGKDYGNYGQDTIIFQVITCKMNELYNYEDDIK
jgi:hypothetical protein